MSRSARLWSTAALILTLTGVIRAEIIEQILVKVNGEIFTKTDLEARQVAVLRQKGLQLDLKESLNDNELRKQLNSVTPQIMAEAVDELLIVQRGRELGYTLSDEQFKTVLENIKRENKLDTEEKFQGALKQENMTMTDLRRQLERSMIIQRVQQNEVFGRIGVTDEEARAYYDAHVAEFTSAASVTLREILVSVPNDGKTINVGLDEAAKDRAEAIRARASGGEDFAKLAAEVSAAPSRANGGLIGPLSMNDLSPSSAS